MSLSLPILSSILHRFAAAAKEIDFDDRLAPLPEDFSSINAEDQIACRFFGRHVISNRVVSFVQFPEQERGEALTFFEVVRRFNLNSRIITGDRPFPPHLIPEYIAKRFIVPDAHRPKKVVFMGLIHRTKRKRKAVQGFEPAVPQGSTLIEMEWHEHEMFGRDHVFAVYQPHISAPHGVPLPKAPKK